MENKPNAVKSDLVPNLKQKKKRHHFKFAHRSHIKDYLCRFITYLFASAESASSPLPEVTLTVWITLMLWRGSVSAHVLNNCVFSSGRGLIQCDWMRLADTVCVCLISVERLRMIGVSDTACFLLGSSSRCGQTGATEVYENDPQLSSVHLRY